MRSSACLSWIHALSASVTAFYPYHPPPSPSALAAGTSPLSSAHHIHTAGERHEGAPGVVKLRLRRQPLDTRAGSHIKRDNNYEFVTASAPAQTNSAAIHNDGTDFSYFTSVEFGSSGKTMYMLVDTGASNTWVMGSNCKSNICSSHNTLGPEDSASLKISQDEFDLTYGTGSVSGLNAMDTVRFAGLNISLPFGLASATSEDFQAYPMDGILGLGPRSGKATDNPTLMETIQEADVLSSNLFGVNLQRSSDGATDGELSFGAPDTTKFDGDLSFTGIVEGASRWEIPIDSVEVDGVSCTSTGRTAIIDTGTSFMLVPPADAEELHGRIPTSEKDGETYHIPCSSKTPIQLKFSGVSYDILPADYVGSPLEDRRSMCTSNIIGRQPFEHKQWLVGDVFLKNVYSVFDYDGERIGK
ncbi:MAG: hypothetical protein Q9186_002364 [Xanthomendoza sp. 1 TL-2023]